MKEFLHNIMLWFSANKDPIIAFFSSSTFLSFVAALVMFIRQNKSIKNNTNSTNTLNESIVENSKIKPTIDGTNEDVKNVKKDVEDIENKIKDFYKDMNDFKDAVFLKMNAMMEVQSVVYSTIKDDTVRKNVQNLLINAKYAETKTRAELEAEVESLKDLVENKLADVQKVVNTTVENVKKTVSIEPKSEEEEDTEVVRY